MAKNNHGIAVTMKAETPPDMDHVNIHLHTDEGGLAFLLIAVGIASEVIEDGTYKLPPQANREALIEAFEDWSDMLNDLYEKRDLIKQ